MAFDAAYTELVGELDRSARAYPSPPQDRLVFTDLRGGAAGSPAFAGITFKYVARGAVHHRIGGRTYSVGEGQFLFLPAGWASELEVRSPIGETTLGVCVFLAEPPEAPAFGPPVEEPLILSGRGSALGGALQAETARLKHGGPASAADALGVLRAFRGEMEGLLEDTARQLAALDTVKSSTRHERLRRLERARGHLHEVTDRAVPLTELAQVAGVSRFQLLRDFRSCFGAPPGAYHRRLRLDLARRDIRRLGLSGEQAARRFGFADAASFGHAFRRTYGCPPGDVRA